MSRCTTENYWILHLTHTRCGPGLGGPGGRCGRCGQEVGVVHRQADGNLRIELEFWKQNLQKVFYSTHPFGLIDAVADSEEDLDFP